MNRIMEINEKNMYAVVEPYVISAQLQAEILKGACICVKGAGTNCSAMLRGHGHWIRPPAATIETTWPSNGSPLKGDIVRSGSLGLGRMVLRRRAGPLVAEHPDQRRAARGNSGRLHQSCPEALSLARAGSLPDTGKLPPKYV